MKIRVWGTEEECKQAQCFYKQFSKNENVKSCSVSHLCANRNSVNQFRVYIDIEYKDETIIFNNLLPDLVN